MSDLVAGAIISAIVAGVAGLLGGYFAFRLRFAEFVAMDVRRESDWAKWREGIDAKLNGGTQHSITVLETESKQHADEIDRLRKAVHELRQGAHIESAVEYVRNRRGEE